MSTVVYMKILEETPENYDRGMRILTFGRIDLIKRIIASDFVEASQKVLEIGCGAGSLAAQMTASGAKVTGIDISEKMLITARKNAPEAEFIHMTVTEVGRLGEKRFDRIVATLSFSELSEDELDFVIDASRRLLKPDGKLVIADEVAPNNWWSRLMACFMRWPLAVITFLVTQNTTHVLKRFEERLEGNGFKIISRKNYLMGTLALIVSEGE